jgi:hypothetical protein
LGFSRKLKGIDHFPVVFHTHYHPAVLSSLVEGFVEAADGGVAVISILAVSIVVMHQQHESRPSSGGSPLQHL